MTERGSVVLKDVCSLIVDSEHKTAPKDADGRHPLIRTTDLGKARADFAGAQRVNAETYVSWTRRAAPATGDLILAREAPVGGICCVPRDVRPVLGQRTVLLRPNLEMVDARFLMYRLAAPDMQARMNAMATGSTVPHLNMADIRSFNVPAVPPLGSQREIAVVLSAFDELIEINERRIELLEDLARSLYREWFVRFRFPGHEDVAFVNSELGLIPDGWTAKRLRDVAQLAYGKSLPAKTRRSGNVPVVSSAGIIDQHDESLVDGPGIVLGRKGNVGAVWWVDDDFFPIDTTYYAVTEQPLGLLYWQLRDLEYIDSHAAVPGLSRDQAYALPLLVPSHEVSSRFGEIHDGIFALISMHRSRNRHLAATRDLLLPRLVTGRLDISDVDLGALLPAEAA